MTELNEKEMPKGTLKEVTKEIPKLKPKKVVESIKCICGGHYKDRNPDINHHMNTQKHIYYMEHGEYKPRKEYNYNYYVKKAKEDRKRKPRREPFLNTDGINIEVRFHDSKGIPRKTDIYYFNLPYEERLKKAEEYLQCKINIFKQL